MASRSQTPSRGQDEVILSPSNPEHLKRGYGAAAAGPDSKEEVPLTATAGHPLQSSPLSQSVEADPALHEHVETGPNVSSAQNGNAMPLLRGNMPVSTANLAAPSRGGTLKKKNSMSRKDSIKRADSKRSARDEPVKIRIIDHDEKLVVGDEDNTNSVYYTPVPTSGVPTEALANRFQGEQTPLVSTGT